MNQGKHGFKKELLFGLLIVTFSLIVTAVLLEVGLRLFGYRGAPESVVDNMMIVDDPVLDWRYIPHSRFQQGKIVSHYNSIGFRGADHSVAKTSNVARIVVIGDSVTEGYGVAWSDAFGPRLQELLGDSHEVISLGMGGLNTPQEVHILEQVGLQYGPDYVVVNFVLNDGDFYSSAREGAKHAADNDSRIALLGISVNPAVKRTLKSSALIYLVNARVADLWGRLKGEPNHDYYGELWRGEESRTKVASSFERLGELKREHGFKVVVLVWPLLVDYEDYQFRTVHDWVVSQAKANGLEAIDLLPAYSQQAFRSLQVTSEDHVHPNATGHDIASREFYGWMNDASSVPE